MTAKWPKVFNTNGESETIQNTLLNLLDEYFCIAATDLFDLFGGAPMETLRENQGLGWDSLSSFEFEGNLLTVQEPKRLEELKMGEKPATIVEVKLAEGQNRTTFEFTSNNPNWSNHEGHNEFFLTAMVNSYNHQLQHYHYVFLNQILRGLGINETAYGQIAGWSANGDGEILMSIEQLVGDDDKVLLHFKRTKVIVMDLGD